MGFPKANVLEGNGEVWCSVEETNRLRAELGLKPLKVEEDGEVGEEEPGDGREVRERVAELRRRREAKSVFAAKGIADEESDGEGAADFVQRLKERTDEVELRRKKAAANARANTKELKLKRAHEGVKQKYDAAALAGLKVRHSLEDLGETVLTLVDQEIVDNERKALIEAEDQLEDIALVNSAKMKTKSLTKPYDAVQELEMGRSQAILSQYDGELADKSLKNNSKVETTPGVKIGGDGSIGPQMSAEARLAAVAERIRQNSRSLETLKKHDVVTPDKSAVTSSRIKRKGGTKKARKRIRQKVDPLEGEETDEEERITRIREARESMLQARQSGRQAADVATEEEEDEDDLELQQAQAYARLVHQRKEKAKPSSVEALASTIVVEEEKKLTSRTDGIIFDEMTEFVRQVRTDDGIEPGKPHQDSLGPDIMDIEVKSEETSSLAAKEEPMVDIMPTGNESESVPGAMATALKHFRLLGDLKPKEEFAGRANDRRNKEWVDSISKGREIKLDYVDEFGRRLTPSEAFRQQSYDFHGQKPSKNKQEKRLKEYVNSVRLQQRNMGVETPLQTVAALKNETKRTKSPFVVVSGEAALTSAASGKGQGNNELLLKRPKRHQEKN